ncbi:cohesin domain-containing protein [candidate division KSB1 bacterium]|nr:cohesin domain-containing protein [candidate division KSB1 bacterium]
MNRKLLLGSLTLWLGLAGTWFGAAPVNAQSQALLAIPAGLAGFPGDTLVVPVFVSTAQAISQAQVVVEFDAKDFTFIDATAGPDAPGFFVLQTLVHPSIPITTSGATENVLVQFAGSGAQTFSGNDRNVLFLHFKVTGATGGASPFAFAADSIATVLVTNQSVLLDGTDLQFINGSGSIANLATLSIPGGFSAPKAETLQVPVRLSSAKAIGVAQMVFDYDGNDLQFLEAKPGPDAADFSILVETNLPFAPATIGTNKNLLITLFSGGAGLLGNDKTILTLNFLAAGEIGGNSPIAFDRGVNRTALSTVDLVDLTGADLAFRDGDATILPPLVTLSGKLFYRSSNSPVSGAEVAITGQSTIAKSDAAGNYVFKGIPQGSYILRPLKTGDVRGAIQGSDALMILRATAFIDTLTGDQEISADVTQDGSTTTSDVLAVLRYLAAQTSGTAQAGNWIFQPATAAMLVQSDTTRNFQAFLLGDVNGSWASASSGLAKAAELPLASVRLGEWRFDEKNAYLSLFAGKEGEVFTLIASFDLPSNVGSALRFVPATAKILAATHFDANNVWRLAMVTADGIAPEEKIGELALPLSVATGSPVWQFKRTEVNDRVMQTTGVENRETSTAIPAEFVLQPNYPNPFNASTWISFGIPAQAGETTVRLEIFTADGRRVRVLAQGKYAPGTHRVLWDGRDEFGAVTPTGVYFYRVQAGKFTASRKLVMVK